MHIYEDDEHPSVATEEPTPVSTRRESLGTGAPDAGRPAPHVDGQLRLSARRVSVRLLWVTLGLTFFSVGVELLDNHRKGIPGVRHLVKLFSLNGEANISAWYSSLLWLVAAALAVAIGAHARSSAQKFALHWFGFAAVCAYLSMDEAAMLHETAGNLIGRVFRRWSFLRLDHGWLYSWMYYGIGVVTAFVLVFRRFLLHLPRPVLGLLCAAGCVYVAGALGVESISAAADHDKIQLGSADVWDLVIGLEECLEMTGVVLLIYALLTHMRTERVSTTLAVRD